jgi:DHA2 family multidrug resistance protein
MSEVSPVFKIWVPQWMIRLTILLVILPCLLIFGLSTANAAAAAGYYGIEPADVQYSMIVFYAAIASFFALERRFFVYIATKEYLIVGMVIQVIAAYVCYRTHHLFILLIFRFVQGIANCGTTSICLTLIFSQLHTERSREIGYSIFYGLLLCITPISLLLTAPIVDAFDYNVLYKGIMFCYLPGAIILYCIMNKVRLTRKMPLHQLDWASFVIYAVSLCLIGYVLIYGQQYYWLQDIRILASVIFIVLLMGLYIFRQTSLKRPSQDMSVFKYRNYIIGAVLIFVLYIVRGALNVTSSYFATVIGMDPIHIAYVMMANIIGIVISVVISSRLMILKRSIRMTWLYGFILLLVFHLWMIYLFSAQADANSFILPLIVQGLGAGMLMTPVIVFAVSSVPQSLGNTASSIGVFFRFFGFCSSTAVINYFNLYNKSNHINRFQEQLSSINILAVDRLTLYKRMLMSRGVSDSQSAKIATGLLSKSVDIQAQIKANVDYYVFICCLLVAVILTIAVIPYISKTIINLKSKQPAPISY